MCAFYENIPSLKPEMNNTTQLIIRISLLFVMVILGLIIVFPQSLDLMDMIIAENRSSSSTSFLSKTNTKPKEPSVSFFARNVAPNRDEVITYIQQLKKVEHIICLGKIPKITYDSDKNKILPARPLVSFEAIFNTNQRPTLTKGHLTIKPYLYTVSSAMPFAQWFGSNRLDGWHYKMSITSAKALSLTQFAQYKPQKIQICKD